VCLFVCLSVCLSVTFSYNAAKFLSEFPFVFLSV
jgi:hypothetical protein